MGKPKAHNQHYILTQREYENMYSMEGIRGTVRTYESCPISWFCCRSRTPNGSCEDKNNSHQRHHQHHHQTTPTNDNNNIGWVDWLLLPFEYRTWESRLPTTSTRIHTASISPPPVSRVSLIQKRSAYPIYIYIYDMYVKDKVAFSALLFALSVLFFFLVV